MKCIECDSENVRQVVWIGIDPLVDQDTLCQCKDCKTIFVEDYGDR